MHFFSISPKKNTDILKCIQLFCNFYKTLDE